mmetsp:Transcript_7409/g.21023  ORF Transcript_7409/g.21023 Transcript_7409/m.21023 type:complete len:206 (+) Transcript_7409:1308-1925(+)
MHATTLGESTASRTLARPAPLSVSSSENGMTMAPSGRTSAGRSIRMGRPRGPRRARATGTLGASVGSGSAMATMGISRWRSGTTTASARRRSRRRAGVGRRRRMSSGTARSWARSSVRAILGPSTWVGTCTATSGSSRGASARPRKARRSRGRTPKAILGGRHGRRSTTRMASGFASRRRRRAPTLGATSGTRCGSRSRRRRSAP